MTATDVQWADEGGTAVLEFGGEDCAGEVWADRSGLVVTAWMDGGYWPQSIVIPWSVIEGMKQRGSDGVRYVERTDSVAGVANQWRPAGGCTLCPGGQHYDERNGPPEVLDDGKRHRHSVPVDLPVTVVRAPT